MQGELIRYAPGVTLMDIDTKIVAQTFVVFRKLTSILAECGTNF